MYLFGDINSLLKRLQIKPLAYHGNIPFVNSSRSIPFLAHHWEIYRLISIQLRSQEPLEFPCLAGR